MPAIRRSLFGLALVASSVALSCGGGGSEPSNDHETPHTHADGTSHTHDDAPGESLSYEELRQTDEFQTANTRYELCMGDAGYHDLDDPEGVLLKDGTRFTGESFTIEGAAADYLYHGLRCEEESGINAVERANGIGGAEMDAGAVGAANDRLLAQMSCMESRGWDIPAPLTLPDLGLMVFDVRVSSEEQAAYDLDYTECTAERLGQ